ncbi:MAG: long-chain fatty acid--CoA ligase [Deltaproteobacteria bacterium]|nr:long-chain fatty acid--CoA ligase [Deltaproteobacteria bacterium]MBW2046920.1 long-chain fatty acid--CoA ligase [Deltaproteobacteria bacterium]MBW2110965.1 long-chain fatty acid--CoA ligase [Deltaproteobacteria bacterium]MBW2351725.1 long-chain fatty acid--CoA ligase [Deltaproteobacteria bacterium]HDZ90123.1 long-chain-fatty-acid--CoA ligase [Deltaproteobacteria bacterium]
MNVGYFLINSARKFPERTAIVSGEGRFTFKELDLRTDRLALAMNRAGLERGDRVGILFFNSVYFVETYFAALKAGLVATPVNFRLARREMAFILENSRAKALFYDPEFEKEIAGVSETVKTLELLVSPRRERAGIGVDYEDLLSTGSDPLSPLPLVGEEDRCQIMYTSGTTGRPKGAVLTHGNVTWNLFNTLSGREDRPGERAIIVGPLFHAAALNNHLTIQIALGGTAILLRRFEPASLLETIERERATVMSGAPALYNMLLDYPDAHEYDLSSIIKCTAGSDRLPMETKKRLLQFFPSINGVYDVYGCTEASPCITILSAGDSLRKDLSVGRALPFLHARIVDEKDIPLAPGEVGELVCSGPNVMAGYHEDPEGTREALRGGWLHTGDMARMDEDGFFYIVDRKKEMIISGGENIYPREVEDVLLTHPAVADTAVAGVPDPVWGESVRAFVVLKEGMDLEEGELIQFCRRHLAGYKRPRKVIFVPAIPKNPLGKVLKHLLKG